MNSSRCILHRFCPRFDCVSSSIYLGHWVVTRLLDRRGLPWPPQFTQTAPLFERTPSQTRSVLTGFFLMFALERV